MLYEDYQNQLNQYACLHALYTASCSYASEVPNITPVHLVQGVLFIHSQHDLVWQDLCCVGAYQLKLKLSATLPRIDTIN